MITNVGGAFAGRNTPTVRDDQPPMHAQRAVLDIRMLDSPSCASQRPRSGSIPRPGCCATGTCSACCRPSAGQHPPAITPEDGNPSAARASAASPRGGTPPAPRIRMPPAPLRRTPPAPLRRTPPAPQQRYDISPAALAFGLRVLTEPGVRADVAELARRIGRIGPLPARALEFEKERALRLLSLAPGRRPERPARRTASEPERPAGQRAEQA